MEIGERINHYRKLCGLTQEDVAKKLQTTPQNIYKYEKGIIKNIPLSSIFLMSELFGISPAELAGMADTPLTDCVSSLSEKEIFGNKLRLKREARGLSVRELAIKLHVLPSIVSDLEKGTYETVSDSMLSNISAFFDTPIEYFSNGEIPKDLNNLNLTDTERLVIVKYRANPQYHNAIHQLLGISSEDDTAEDNSLRYRTLTSTDFDNASTRSRIAQTQMSVYHTEKRNNDK